MLKHRTLLGASLGLVVMLAFAAPSHGAGKKAIWGGSELQAGNSACPTAARCSAFPTYSSLGVDIYQIQLNWNEIAPTPPANPLNPSDPAYIWPQLVDTAVQAAAASGIEVAILVQRTPPWANGGAGPITAPANPQDFANFLTAAANRYPFVRKWMIWGEPSRSDNFLPNGSRSAVRIYSRLLNASYAALKALNSANTVIGGMTVNGGDILPPQFIKFLKVKGKMPKMDLYGHNPFDRRFPNIKKKPIGRFRGLNDVDTLWQELKTAYRGQKRGRPKGLFLSEWTLPTSAATTVFNDGFFVSPAEQARRITAAYRMVEKLKYVKALGWFSLQDQAPTAGGNAWGLMSYAGAPKPGFGAYAAVP